MTDDSQAYAENYKILENIHQKLQNSQNSPHLIDELAPLLEKGSKSYRICSERISQAEKLIAEFEKGLQNVSTKE